MPSFKPVIALARGLEILRVINEDGKATVRRLHEKTGLDKATIVRMLETLAHEGYVMRDADDAVYAPTGRTLLLSQGYDQHLWIGRTAEPILQEFRRQVGWPSDIAFFDRDAMVVAQTTREDSSMFFSRRPGFRFPLLATSLGLAYLAFCGEDEQNKIIETLAAIPDRWNDLARNRKRLNKALAEIRQRGYALMDSRYSRSVFGNSVWALGTAVRTDRQVFASINIMMLRSAVPVEEGIRRYAEPLRDTAARIASALSVRHPPTLSVSLVSALPAKPRPPAMPASSASRRKAKRRAAAGRANLGAR
jgi:IclR family transcriptional regulator, mhp operon transcriptional activator